MAAELQPADHERLPQLLQICDQQIDGEARYLIGNDRDNRLLSKQYKPVLTELQAGARR